MTYYQSNEPYNKQAGNEGFDWGKAATGFAVGSGLNFAQDVVVNKISQGMAKTKVPILREPGRFLQDLMYDTEKGSKLNENVGFQRMASWINEKEGANTWKNNKILQKIPNMVPGTTFGKVMGYGIIPAAGAIFAGFTGKTTTEVAANTASSTIDKTLG